MDNEAGISFVRVEGWAGEVFLEMSESWNIRVLHARPGVIKYVIGASVSVPMLYNIWDNERSLW